MIKSYVCLKNRTHFIFRKTTHRVPCKIIPFSYLFLLVNSLVFSFTVLSQSLTSGTKELLFGNVYENAPDSLPLTIQNISGRDLTITGIRFYNTYGQPAFSTLYSWFVIPANDSATIFIKFSPRHNILHNSEMVIENDGLRGYLGINLLGQGKFSDTYYNLTENLSEETLKTVLRLVTGNGFNSLGYNIARDSMFMFIDNKKFNGQGATQNTIECIYTGREAIGYTDRTDCQTNFSFNTEHTFPQSLFSSQEPMRSDLHHLFPTDDGANNERANNPFGVVTNPSWNSGGSLSDGTTFEPRDEYKGAIARALFYFVIRYQNYSNFLNSQENILRSWHDAFMPGITEHIRNDDTYILQQNKNPFIDYPVFTERIHSISANSFAPLTSSIDLTEDTIIYGTVQQGNPAIYNYVIVNNGNTDIQFSNFNLTHPAVLSFATPANDTMISPGESLPLQIRCETVTTDSIRGHLTFNTNASGNLQVSVPVFVNDLVFTTIEETAADFIVAPNPANDYLFIVMPGGAPVKFELFDLHGKSIISSIAENNSGINLEKILPGIYFLRISGNINPVMKKIIINR